MERAGAPLTGRPDRETRLIRGRCRKHRIILSAAVIVTNAGRMTVVCITGQDGCEEG
jgi:hypothetical protein